MKRLRTHQQDRRKYIVPIVALFCILGAITLANRADDLYKALDVTLNVATGIDVLDFKELDEAIAALEVEISKLEVKLAKVTQRLVKRTKIFELAKSEFEKAKSNLEDVNKKIKNTKSEYKQAAYYEKWYLKSYMNHTASCDYCSGQQMCSEGSELHSNWQTFVKKRKTAKKAWDAAKSEFPPAYDRYFLYWRSYRYWERALTQLEGESLHIIVTKKGKMQS